MKKDFGVFLSNYQKALRKTVNYIKRMLWVLARNAFLVILALVFAAVAFGGILFYNYVLLPEDKELNVSGDIIGFREEIYKSVMEERSRRESAFNNPFGANYQNPFYYITNNE